MLIFRRAVFLHVPKTGGIWVRDAVGASHCEFDEYLVDGDIHGDLSYSPFRERFTFAFVRHPLTLYRSYWSFKMNSGWDPANPFDDDCAADRFPVFVENVLTRYPAWCSRMYEDYVGPPDRPIDFIGRFERLTADLIDALRLAGERCDEWSIRATPPVNVSGSHEAHWTTDLAAAVVTSEADAFRRFGYDTTL